MHLAPKGTGNPRKTPSPPTSLNLHELTHTIYLSSIRWNSIITHVLKPIASGRNSFSPNSLDRNVLESYIADCRQLHKQLDDVLDLNPSTTAVLEAWPLRRARILLRERIERCSIALTPGPIRRLPPEIFSEIFCHCLPQACRPDPSTAPLLLCRISPLWRDIACATRRLWNHLDFTSLQKPDLTRFIQASPFHKSALQQWLSRASRSQLALSFDRSYNDVLPGLVDAVLLPSVVDLLSLEIRLPLRVSYDPFRHFFALPPSTLRCLKFLVLTQGLPDESATVFQSSPCLTHLSLNDLEFAVHPYEHGDVPVLYPVFPWAQITHLNVTRFIEPETWVSALSSCRSLEVGCFSINLRGDSDSDPSGSDSSDSEDRDNGHTCGSALIPIPADVVLPQLRELDLIVGCGKAFPFQGLRFPALKALRFHHGHMPHVSPHLQRLAARKPDRFSWKNSRSFLSALGPLKILSLAGRIGSVEEIMILLHQVPSVDFLDLNLHVDHLALLSALTVGVNAQPTTAPLPHLGYLRLLLDYADDIPSSLEQTIQDMVVSRHPARGVCRLKNLSVISNTFRRRHLDTVTKIAENINFHVPTELDIDLDSSRVVPWRRAI